MSATLDRSRPLFYCTSFPVRVVKKMPAEVTAPRVLVVDDDRSLADALSIMLNQHGFDTRAAYSGAEAIRAALNSPPDFIIMDIRMDGIDGVDTAIAICETLPRCRILLMSGAEHASQLEKSSKRGHHFDLLMKPVLATALLEKLRFAS